MPDPITAAVTVMAVGTGAQYQQMRKTEKRAERTEERVQQEEAANQAEAEQVTDESRTERRREVAALLKSRRRNRLYGLNRLSLF